MLLTLLVGKMRLEIFLLVRCGSQTSVTYETTAPLINAISVIQCLIYAELARRLMSRCSSPVKSIIRATLTLTNEANLVFSVDESVSKLVNLYRGSGRRYRLGSALSRLSMKTQYLIYG